MVLGTLSFACFEADSMLLKAHFVFSDSFSPFLKAFYLDKDTIYV